MSLHDVFVQLRDRLKANGVPFEVAYGPQPVPMKVGTSRLQVMRDYESGDAVLPTRSQRPNPNQVAVRAVGGIVRIFASSTLEGAQRHNHEAIADQLADQVHVALHRIVQAGRTLWRVQRMGLLPDGTVDGWSGVVFEIRFQIDHGVEDRSWTGEAAPEGSFTTGATSLSVSGPGVSTDLPNATTRIS